MSQAPQDSASGAKNDVRNAAEEAQHALSEEVRKAKAAGRSYADEARKQAISRAEGGKNQVAGEVSRFAGALHDAAGNLDEGSIQAQLLHRAAASVDEAAASMKEKDLGDMAASVADFGRRNPAVFLGGAAFLGFALARFAAAGSRDADARADRPANGRGNLPKASKPNGGAQ